MVNTYSQNMVGGLLGLLRYCPQVGSFNRLVQVVAKGVDRQGNIARNIAANVVEVRLFSTSAKLHSTNCISWHGSLHWLPTILHENFAQWVCSLNAMAKWTSQHSNWFTSTVRAWLLSNGFSGFKLTILLLGQITILFCHHFIIVGSSSLTKGTPDCCKTHLSHWP